MESKSEKPSDVTENNADANLYKCRIQHDLAASTGNTADESLAAAKSTSKTNISVARCLCNERSIKKSLRHVSCIRGPLRTIDSKKNCEGSSFSVVRDDKELISKGRLYFDDLDVSDSDFYPTDVASEMLQRDEEDSENESTTMTDLDCCSCSSRSVCSEKNVSQISLHLDSDNHQSRKKRVAVDEFIRARTEYLGSPSDGPFRQRPCFDSDVVSPFPKDLLSSTPATNSAGLEIEKKNPASVENAKWSEKNLRDKNDINVPQKVKESSGFSDFADANLYKCRIQQDLAASTGNTADGSLVAAKSTSKTNISVARCLCNERSIKKSLRHVSCIRGSLRTIDSKKNCEGSSFSVVREDKELNPKRRLYFDDLDVSDSNFYPTDVVSEMLQRDEEDHEKESITMTDLDCCSCISRSVFSEKDVSPISLHLYSNSHQARKKRVAVDEFIRARTEYLGSPSDGPFRQRPYIDSDVFSPFPKDLPSSTPATKSAGLEIEKKYSSSDENAKWSEKKLRDKNDVNFSQKVRKSAGFSDRETTVGQGSLSTKSQMKVSLVSSQNSLSSNKAQSLCREATEFWTVQPQELTMDINSKSVRILLINNSTEHLKFTTKFDANIINVCPVSGILPAKDQMGMRILLSSFIKRMNENAEDTITVTCGKTKKNVSIKVCKGRKPIPAAKDKTYIRF